MVRCEPGELSELCHVSRRRRRRGRWARTRPSPTTTSTTPPTPTRRRSWRSWTRPSPASNFPPHLPQMRPGPSQTGERRRDDGQTEHQSFQSIYGGENCDSKQERTPEEQQPAVVTNQLHLHHHHQPAQLPQQAGGEQAEVLLQLLLSPLRLLLCSSGLSGRNLLGCPCLQVK